MILCGACRGAVDIDDPGVVYAVELREAPTFLGSELVVGVGVYFHGECFPRDSPGYLEMQRRTVLGSEGSEASGHRGGGAGSKVRADAPFPSAPDAGNDISPA
jgi:hypothetical protein